MHLPLHTGHRLNDGFWHSVHLVARDGSAVVTIDDDDGGEFRVAHPFQLRTGNQYFFGGEQQGGVYKNLAFVTLFSLSKASFAILYCFTNSSHATSYS